MPEHELSPIPNYQAFIGWGFQCLLLAIVTWGVTELSTLSRSVQALDIKMAVVVERDNTRTEQVKDLETRVKVLEEDAK